MSQRRMSKLKLTPFLSLSQKKAEYHQKCMQEEENIVSRTTAIQNIMNYSNQNNNIIQKYSEDFFLDYFDKQNIENLSKTTNYNIELSRQDFIRYLATFIKHDDDQTLFLVMNLIKVYKKIKNQTKNQVGIKISDFTSYICQKISAHNQQRLLQLKQISADKIDADPFKLRAIDLQPPIIMSEIQKQIPQIEKSLKKKDKKVDSFRPLYQFFVSPTLNIIMTLGRLASSIRIYNLKLEQKKQINPNCFKKIQKKLAILSMAFSQKYKRIGCIINNIGLAFWDFSDNFKTQKVIQKVLGSKIYYLQLFDEWITSDNDTIYYWNIKQEVVKGKIKENSKYINDVEEIIHLRSIAVSYTLLDQTKWVIIYQPQKISDQNNIKNRQQNNFQFNFKRLTKIKLDVAGCHTIYYNKFTQSLIPLGYKNTIPVYSINNKSFDLSLICELRSHQTIVTSITEIPETDIIFTGDDRGNVIVWTLTNMRCQQIIKIANWIGNLKCLGNKMIYSDDRLNIIPLENLKINLLNNNKKGIAKKQHIFGIFKYYFTQKSQLFIFTRKQCRILNMITGKTLKVFILCPQDQEILTVQSYLNGFLIGTSKGDIFNYSLQFKLRWQKLSAHSSEVLHLRGDPINKFFLSSGKQSSIYIWSQKNIIQEGPRKQLINNDPFYKQEVNLVELSQKYGLFVTSSFQNSIKIWDYESCKLCDILQLQAQPSFLVLSSQIPLLIIGCLNKKLFLFKFSRKQAVFDFKLIGSINQQKNQINRKSINQNRTRLSYSIHSKQAFEIQSKIGDSFNLNQPNTVSIENILFDNSQNEFKLFISYGKGSVTYYNIHNLIQQNFSKDVNQFKKSANVQRPIKQNMIKQIYKSPFQKSSSSKKHQYSSNLVKDLQEKHLVWNKKLHKDLVTSMNVFQSKYISTMCIDGYYKLTSLYQGEIICSLNINYPLPVEWNYQVDKSQQLCGRILQTLTVIQQLINNNQKPLTKEQFQVLNVKPFLDMICCQRRRKIKKKTIIRSPGVVSQYVKQQNYTPQNKKVQILKQEFSPLDIKGISSFYPTLKSYQIYKRVKKIKENHKQNSDNFQKLQLNKKKQLIQQRQSLIQFLSPNYLPKLLNKDISDQLVLSEKYKNKAHPTLTKDDFKKYVYETSVNFNQKQKIWPSKSLSRKQMVLQKSNIFLQTKNNAVKSNEYQDRSFNTTKSNLLKQINDKICKFKKQRKENKVL